MPLDHPLYSIGHSNQDLVRFRMLLEQFSIQVLADVRSQPVSRYVPHFNKETLADYLQSGGIKYLFLGRELGGRPDNPDYYDGDGHVLYGRVAEDARFLKGLERLERGRPEFRVALMCSEENPAICHRHLLIGRVLSARGVPYFHIRGDGVTQSEQEVQRTGGKKTDVFQPTLFGDLEEMPWRSLKPLAGNLREDEFDGSE